MMERVAGPEIFAALEPERSGSLQRCTFSFSTGAHSPSRDLIHLPARPVCVHPGANYMTLNVGIGIVENITIVCVRVSVSVSVSLCITYAPC